MNLETKITIYKFTPQVFTLTLKYRYLLMQGWANGEVLDMLETKFNWQRDNDFIQILTDSVIDFEYRSKKQAEALERARLLNEQAEQLRKEADKLGKP